MHRQPVLPPHLLRLADAGDAKPAWITLLTTEHYALGMQRAATISEVNGRASIFCLTPCGPGELRPAGRSFRSFIGNAARE